MYQTIEAIYDKGRIYPIDENIHIKKTRVLLTILNKNEKAINEGTNDNDSKLSKIFLEAKNHKIGDNLNVMKMDGDINNDIF